jgi:hypothetical protein
MPNGAVFTKAIGIAGEEMLVRKFKLVLPAALAAALLLLGGVQFAASASGGSGSSSAAPQTGRAPGQPWSTQTVIHTAPLRTYFSTGNSGVVISGFTPVGPQLFVTCPGSTGKCKIEIDNSVQFGANSTAANEVGVFELLDGVTYSSPGGPYNGELPTDGLYQNDSFIETFSGVLHGTHAIQPLVATLSGPATIELYSIVVRVYKP